MQKQKQTVQTLFRLVVCSGLTLLMTIFQSYHNGIWLWQEAQCSLLQCWLTEVSCPRHLTWYHTQSPVTLSWHWVDQSWLYPVSLSAKRGAASTIFKDVTSRSPEWTLYWLSYRVGPDQTAQSDLGLHCSVQILGTCMVPQWNNVRCNYSNYWQLISCITHCIILRVKPMTFFGDPAACFVGWLYHSTTEYVSCRK